MILTVLPDTHPKLRRIAHPANPDLAHHRTLARRLLETMNSHKALGIAANQVHPGELVRIIALNTNTYKGVMFNPEIIEIPPSELRHGMREGCLSTTEPRMVWRHFEVVVKFVTMAKEEKTLKFMGEDAHVVQHEIDHLNGILITDYKEPVTSGEGT